MNVMAPREVVTVLISSMWPWLERCHINSQQIEVVCPPAFYVKRVCHIFWATKAFWSLLGAGGMGISTLELEPEAQGQGLAHLRSLIGVG